MGNHSYENVFSQQVHFRAIANQTHFHMKGFARGLVLKPRHKVTTPCQAQCVEPASKASNGSEWEGRKRWREGAASVFLLHSQFTAKL